MMLTRASLPGYAVLIVHVKRVGRQIVTRDFLLQNHAIEINQDRS